MEIKKQDYIKINLILEPLDLTLLTIALKNARNISEEGEDKESSERFERMAAQIVMQADYITKTEWKN